MKPKAKGSSSPDPGKAFLRRRNVKTFFLPLALIALAAVLLRIVPVLLHEKAPLCQLLQPVLNQKVIGHGSLLESVQRRARAVEAVFHLFDAFDLFRVSHVLLLSPTAAGHVFVESPRRSP